MKIENLVEKLESVLRIAEPFVMAGFGLVSVLNQIPIGYECNQQTWNNLVQAFPPAPKIFGEQRSSLGDIFIHVNAECADGFHPIYAIQKEKD